MKELCERLTERTGLEFDVSRDTCEPYARGGALNYWVSTWKDGFTLEANSLYDKVFSGPIAREPELIDKINELENSYR